MRRWFPTDLCAALLSSEKLAWDVERKNNCGVVEVVEQITSRHMCERKTRDLINCTQLVHATFLIEADRRNFQFFDQTWYRYHWKEMASRFAFGNWYIRNFILFIWMATYSKYCGAIVIDKDRVSIFIFCIDGNGNHAAVISDITDRLKLDYLQIVLLFVVFVVDECKHRHYYLFNFFFMVGWKWKKAT